MPQPPLDRPHFVLTGGGTGGHLFPGLAVAEQLATLQPDAQVTIAGTGPPSLFHLIERAGHHPLRLACRPLAHGPIGLFRFAAANALAYWTSLRFLARRRPAAVIGLGGYASVPMARAATTRRIPLILLEQNAVPGKATRYLARGAEAVCLALPQAKAALPANCPIQMTGNPVRRAFAESATPPDAPAAGPRQLLILGGSGGAQALNQTVPKVLASLRKPLAAWRIVHQTGHRDLEATRRGYAAAGLRATVVPWLDDMARQMAHSRLAISRAGGTTLAELAIAGLPAVVVPYPPAADDHQRANARAYWAAGAAEVVDQTAGPVSFDQALTDALAHLLVTPTRLAEMREAMLLQARPSAAHEVARTIMRLANLSPIPEDSGPLMAAGATHPMAHSILPQ